MKLGTKLVYVVAMVMTCAAIGAPWPGLAHGADNDAELIRSPREIAKEFLDANNEMRVAAGVASPLVWNETLVEVAKSYTEQRCTSLATSCTAVSMVDSVILVSRCVLGLQSPRDVVTLRPDNMGVVSQGKFAGHHKHHKHCHDGGDDGGDGEGGDASIDSSTTGFVSRHGLAPSPSKGRVSRLSPFPSPHRGGTPSTSNIVDGEKDEDEEECDGGEGDDEELEVKMYGQVMMSPQTMNMGCYNLLCTKNGMSYAACGYYP